MHRAKRQFRYLFYLCFHWFVFTGCNDQSEIGTDFLQEGSFSVLYTDTLSMKVSTVIFDSLATSGSGRLLIGKVDDPQLGIIRSSSYFQVAPTITAALDQNISYDYLALHLNYDHYSYYDTTRALTLSAFEVDEDIEQEDDGKLYNNRSFKIKQVNGNAIPLGSVTFAPNPIRQDTLEIKLSDQLGEELLKLAIAGDTKVTTKREFLDFFKGILLTAENSANACFLGFKPTASLRLYYIDNNLTPRDQRYIDFPIGNNIYFNQIYSDRSATSLKNLATLEDRLSSSVSDNTTYLQAGVGLGIRVEIPHLRSILQFDKDLIISQAVIKIKPLNYSYDNSENTPLSRAFSVYAVDKFNDLLKSYQSSLSLFNDELLDRDTHYAADITDFVKTQLRIVEKNENALLFFPQSPGSTVNRVYAGDANNKYTMELRVYYTIVK
jgi:hypothetical protein